ncbi:helicase associated domain-containing protein [Streptomyces anulatus]
MLSFRTRTEPTARSRDCPNSSRPGPALLVGISRPRTSRAGAGRWLVAQQEGWEQLSQGQRERLVQLGVRPSEKPVAEAVAVKARPRRAAGGARAGAFERGLVALAQYTEREGTVVVGRSWSEELPDGTSVRLGVWLSNTRTRRAGLSEEQLERLAALGVEWAQA